MAFRHGTARARDRNLGVMAAGSSVRCDNLLNSADPSFRFVEQNLMRSIACCLLSICLWWLVAPLLAEETPMVVETSWGTITPLSQGEFLLSLKQQPLPDTLSLPTPFLHMVLCETSQATPVPVTFEFNSDATTLTLQLPPQFDSSRPLRVQTSETSQQFADGRLVFSALDAQVNGQRAKLESHPGSHRIGFWSNADDTVEWNYQATRPGRYEVLLTYSCAGSDGNEIELQLAGPTGDPQVLSTQLKSTHSWYRYTTTSLGKAYLDPDGARKVTVRCTKLVGSAVMNLKAVLLIPVSEGTPPVQAADGSVTLHARDATVHGVKMRWEPLEHKQTLGYWVNPNDWASWTFSLQTPGEFEVEVLQGCGKGQGGSDMEIGTTDQPLTWQVEDTGHFQNFKPRVIGRLKFEQAGQYEVYARPTKIAHNAACDIRQIRLTPVPQ